MLNTAAPIPNMANVDGSGTIVPLTLNNKPVESLRHWTVDAGGYEAVERDGTDCS